MMGLKGKVAMVTGAAQGIGRGIALRLAREGADIALNVRQEDDRASSAREEILACGVRCEVLAADVSDVAAVRAMIARAEALFTHLDVLVNNAGIATPPSNWPRSALPSTWRPGRFARRSTPICWRTRTG